jgi:hypothetical protein
MLAGVATITGLAFAATSRSDNMVAGEYLFPGQRVVAAGCYYHLDMQSDGNLVTYGNSSARWSTSTNGRAGYAVFQTDGNFVLRNWNDAPIWNTATVPHSGARLVQQSDGNLVVYDGTAALWASGVSGESIGQSPCFRTTSKTVVQTNIDRPGGDYRDQIPQTTAGVITARASYCGFYCATDSLCKAYTYVPPGVRDGNPHCLLKSSVPAAVSRSGFVSGRIVKF